MLPSRIHDLAHQARNHGRGGHHRLAAEPGRRYLATISAAGRPICAPAAKIFASSPGRAAA